jgi:hypothetical protein
VRVAVLERLGHLRGEPQEGRHEPEQKEGGAIGRIRLHARTSMPRSEETSRNSDRLKTATARKPTANIPE